MHKNKYKLIVNFWALWCAPCIQEIPDLNKINKMVKKHDFKIILINQDNKKEFNNINLFIKKHNLQNEMVFLDPNKEIGRKFKLRGIPTTFIVNKDGHIDWRIESIIDAKDIKFINWLINEYN